MTGISPILILDLICTFFSSEIVIAAETNSKCKSIPDGFYADGCSQRYYGCANEITIYFRCPPDLYFNGLTKICDYRDNVPTCNTFGKKATSTGTHAELETKYSCPSKKNAFYSLGACRQDYLVCRDGVATVSMCRNGLFYDPIAKNCVTLSSMRSCNPIPMQLEEFESSGFSGSMCIGRPNEVVALICSKKYYVCDNNGSVSMNCPAETVYNIQTNRCDYKDEVRSCNSLQDRQVGSSRGMPETISESTTFATTIPVEESTRLAPDQKTTVKPAIAVSEGIPVASDFVDPSFCVEKDDGDYLAGECENVFVSCSNHTIHMRKCPYQLVFDGKTCEYRQHIPACEPLISSSVAEAATMTTTSQTIVSKNGAAAASKKDKICVSGSVYAEGPCFISYFECKNDKLVRQTCPTGQIFDHLELKCTHKSTICDIDKLDNRVFEGLPLDCEPGEIRQRGQCMNTYYECIESRKFALVSCDVDLMFDPSLKQCRPQSLILDCGEGVEPLIKTSPQSFLVAPELPVQKISTVNPVMSVYEFVVDPFEIPLVDYSSSRGDVPITRTHPSVAPMVGSSICPEGSPCSELYGFRYRTKRRVDDTVIPKEDRGSDIADSLCISLHEGKYGLVGCRPDYLMCFEDGGKIMRCTSGLVYNSRRKDCDYPNEVFACAGQEVIGVPIGPRAPEDSLLNTISSGIEAGDKGAELVISEMECDNDGLYEIGCASVFLVCTNRSPTLFRCPDGLFFDGRVKACILREAARNCKTTLEDKNIVTSTHDETKVVANVIDPEVSFDCSNANDGIYASECSTFYTICKDKQAGRSLCAEGFRFDLTVFRCVPKKFCGNMNLLILNAESRLEARIMTECTDVSIEYPAQPSCRKYYHICKEGKSQVLSCPGDEVFSVYQQKCVSPTDCEKSLPDETVELKSSFCALKIDGMYRHPSSCSRVVQCYKGEGFEHVSCPKGLVFNEVSAACDYAAKYPECPQESVVQKEVVLSDVCSEKEQGEFWTSENCSKHYYRCTWGKASHMECPEGTVYDTVWNICDYKENVKSCKLGPSS